MERIKGFIPLSELADLIENLVKDAFYNQSYWVVAETSDVKNYPDRGYCFVTLVEKEGKDTLARLEGVIWSKQYHIIREFEVASGIRFDKNIRLLLKVMVDFSAQYGLKLIIQDIDPSFSIGNLELEKKKILNRLLAENPDVIHYVDGNYITVNKRLTLPLALQRIALLTAPQSDGLRDFRHELEENPYGYRFIIDEYLTQIQGRRAEYQIVDQLEAIARLKNRYDIAVIARGGGSQLDFGPFDTYEAGLAVAGFNLPLITGIGHERNVSIVDMMSLLPVKTPTKAAAFIIEHNRRFEEEILQMVSYALTMAEELFEASSKSLERLKERYLYAAELFLYRKKNALDTMQLAVKHLDPVNTLMRGFAMIKKDGEIITDPEALQVGDDIDVHLRDSVLTSVIKFKKRDK